MITQEILQQADSLLQSRGIAGHRAADRFRNDFKAYLTYFDVLEYGDAEEVIALLSDNNNLTDSKILQTNFRKSLTDLISPALRNNKMFMEMFNILIDNNGKGVGAGELILPLIFSNYKFSNESDGMVYLDDKWNKVEIKKDGASLKPVKTGLTEKGLVDKLNAKYWKGTVPGKKSKKLFYSHRQTVTDPTLYRKYFEELYVGCDVDQLSTEVETAYIDHVKFNTAVGKFALREYQKVDDWSNIMYIDAEKGTVVNIADVDNVDDLGLKFSPVMKRGKDTQAIADGYVNVNI
jgi:hypothetical protein